MLSSTKAGAAFHTFLQRLEQGGSGVLTGLQSVPVVSLEQSLSYIDEERIPAAVLRAARDAALERADQLLETGLDRHRLSRDDIAAIHLYTQENPIYGELNAALRTEQREEIKPFWTTSSCCRPRYSSSPKTSRACCSAGSESRGSRWRSTVQSSRRCTPAAIRCCGGASAARRRRCRLSRSFSPTLVPV